MPDDKDALCLAGTNRFNELVRFAQRNGHRLQAQPLSQRRGCLLGALQVRDENLLNLRVGKRVRKTFRAPVPCVTERGVRFIGNFVRVAHEKNGARVLSARTGCKNEM
jgi:hypothetical protein